MSRTFRIAPDHPALDGHFPGDPIVPGVVILEHALIALGLDAHPGLQLPQVKFLQPLRPDEEARIETSGAAPRWRFRVVRGDVLLASGEVHAP